MSYENKKARAQQAGAIRSLRKQEYPFVQGTKKDMIQDKQIVSLKKKVKKLEHSEELKYNNLTNSLTAISTTANIYSLSAIGQGDDYNQRVGEELTAKYLNVKMRIRHFANANADVVRVIIFWDKQVNGVGPVAFTSASAVDALLDDTNVGQVCYAQPNYRTKHRYTILYDKLHIMNPDSSGVNLTKAFKFNTNLGGAKQKFSDSGATYTSQVSRGLFLMVFGNDCDATTSFQHNTRFWYTDS